MSKFLHLKWQKSYWENNKNKRDYNHKVVQIFAEQRILFLQRFIDLSRIETAFDYGCGDGFSSFYMRKVIPKLEGGDISNHMLKFNPLDKRNLHVLDGEVLPFSDDSYEMVYCWEVLHHVENPEIAVQEMVRVASKYVVIFEPNGLNPANMIFGLINNHERGIFRFRKGYLKKLANQNNLKIRTLCNVGWIFPNMTPVWLCHLLKLFPFEFPCLTNTICLIAEKRVNHPL